MAARQRPGPGSLSARLRETPQPFELLQALLVLEKERPDTLSLARGNDPHQEVVKLRGPLTPGFAPSQISLIESSADASRVTVHTSVFGLGGPDGPLPYAYQEWLQQRSKVRDTATAEFLDMFQHRLLSLLYRVQRKHRLALPFCRPEDSPAYRQLLALCGLPCSPATTRPYAHDAPLVARTALFANVRRSVAGLRNVLHHHFQLPVRVEDFQGGWRQIPEASQSTLGCSGRNHMLGRTALAGRQVWDQHLGIRVTLGPLERSVADAFLPHQRGYRQLARMVAAYMGPDLHCALRLRLTSAAALRLGPGETSHLGLDTWLNSEEREGEALIELQLNVQRGG